MSEYKEQRRKVFPCVIYRVPAEDPIRKLGWEFHVQDIDGDTFYFHNRERMLFVLEVHSMKAVTEQKMEQLRQKRANRMA